MAATRIIIRPNYLFARGLIPFVLSCARRKVYRPTILRARIIEMTIHRAGRDFDPPIRQRIFDNLYPLEDFFRCVVRRIMPAALWRGVVHTHMYTGRTKKRGLGPRLKGENPADFRTGPPSTPSLSVFRIYARPTGNRPERCVFAPKTGFSKDQRITGGKRLSTNLTVTNRIRRLTDF